MPAQGRQGTRLRCVATGTGLAGLHFSGTGVRAEPAGGGGRRVEFIVHIAAEAAPGPRDTAPTGGGWSGVLFVVLPASGYGTGRGIGSHLI